MCEMKFFRYILIKCEQRFSCTAQIFECFSIGMILVNDLKNARGRVGGLNRIIHH